MDLAMTDLDTLVQEAQALFAQATTPADLENAKALFLGKSGRMTELMKGCLLYTSPSPRDRG